LSLLTGTPSTTNSGWLLPLIEFAPRMVIFVEPPVVPASVMLTPATLPWSWSTKLSARELLSSALVTCCCAVPSWLFCRSRPSAVVTTVWSWVASGERVKFCVAA
jgi:hypothetical protein